MPTFMIADTTGADNVELPEANTRGSLDDSGLRNLRAKTKVRIENAAQEIRRVLGDDVHLNVLGNIGVLLANLTEEQAQLVRNQLPHLALAHDVPLERPNTIIEEPPEARL